MISYVTHDYKLNIFGFWTIDYTKKKIFEDVAWALRNDYRHVINGESNNNNL